MRRSHRLLMGGLTAALGALVVTSASAQQLRSAPDPRSGVTVNYSSLSTGLGSSSQGSRSGSSLMSGLSLNNLSLTKPTEDNDATGSKPSTERRGSIQFDMAPGAPLTPYVGLAFGGVAGRVSDGVRLGAGYSNDNGSDAVRSYQGLAGLAYQLEKGTKLDFGYRFGSQQRPVGLADNQDIAGAERDQAAVLSLRWELPYDQPRLNK